MNSGSTKGDGEDLEKKRWARLKSGQMSHFNIGCVKFKRHSYL